MKHIENVMVDEDEKTNEATLQGKKGNYKKQQHFIVLLSLQIFYSLPKVSSLCIKRKTSTFLAC